MCVLNLYEFEKDLEKKFISKPLNPKIKLIFPDHKYTSLAILKFKNTLSIIMALFAGFSSVFGQQSLDNLIDRYNTRSIPYISVQELRMDQKNYLVLDTRKQKEYKVSHIPGAIWASERPTQSFMDSLTTKKQKPIVVYCTVGIRSEDFGEKLKKMGFTNVKNLYGSIFAWKDEGYPVIDLNGKETEKVHTYSRIWSKYLKSGVPVY